MDNSGVVPRKGMTLVGSDGETVGQIDLVESSYVIVKKGGIFPQDHFIAVSDIIAEDDDGTLRLAIPAQEALDRGLGNPMAAFRGDERATDLDAPTLDAASSRDMTTGDAEPARDGLTVDEVSTDTLKGDVETVRDDTRDTDVVADVPEPASLHTETSELEADVEDEPVRDDMHQTITLSEEEVLATTRPVERGVVRVQKQVIEEKVTLEVPLVEDEVQVTRRRVDRELTDADAPFREDHLEIPLRGQGVEIEKQSHVVEEVDIGKTAHQEIREVTETVRRETARVEGYDVEEISEDTNARVDRDEPSAS